MIYGEPGDGDSSESESFAVVGVVGCSKAKVTFLRFFSGRCVVKEE